MHRRVVVRAFVGFLTGDEDREDGKGLAIAIFSWDKSEDNRCMLMYRWLNIKGNERKHTWGCNVVHARLSPTSRLPCSVHVADFNGD